MKEKSIRILSAQVLPIIPSEAKISENDAIQIAQEAYRKISGRKADSLSVNYFQYALDMETPLYS